MLIRWSEEKKGRNAEAFFAFGETKSGVVKYQTKKKQERFLFNNRQGDSQARIKSWRQMSGKLFRRGKRG